MVAVGARTSGPHYMGEYHIISQRLQRASSGLGQVGCTAMWVMTKVPASSIVASSKVVKATA